MSKRRSTQQKTRAQASEATPVAKKLERRPGELSTFQKAVVIVFIVIFALSTLAGALASVFQSTQGQSVEYDVDYVDSQYEDYVADLESQLEGDPENAETLLATARACSTWGTTVMMLAADDAEAAHGTELVEHAVGYYDRYLALDNASDARAERAMCEYYLGDAETATADLEALTTDDPEYATGWYDLGLLYEGQGQSDEALAAYQKAVELDPDDEQGVGSSAQSRVDELTGAADDEGADDATSDDSSETGE